MTVINTNVSSLIAQNAMAVNARSQTTAMQQLSTGQRINGAKDDAAGLAIAAKMTSQIKGLDQAVRNSNDAISLLQTADGAMVEVTNMLQRMRELAVQSSNDTNASSDRTALQTEFAALQSEIGRIGSTTQWNGTNILNGNTAANSKGTFVFQVGANNSSAQQISVTIAQVSNTGAGTTSTPGVATTTAASLTGATTAIAQVSTVTMGATNTAGDTISLEIGGHTFGYTVGASETATTVAASMKAAINADATLSALYTADNSSGALSLTAKTGSTPFSLTASTAGGVTSSANSIDTLAHAQASIDAVDTGISKINTSRANLGASINRLTYAADNLSNVSQNTSASRSRILDTDYAKASSELARTQIIAQASTAMLAQANQSQQSVLALLK